MVVDVSSGGRHPKGGVVVPTAEGAAASINEAAKAMNVDAGILGHHKHIEVARVLCEITRTRTLAPEIATREDASINNYENFVVSGQFSAWSLRGGVRGEDREW